jgi:hypothetical protein
VSRRPSLLARLAGAILLAALAAPAAAAAHRAPSAFAGWLDGGDAGEAATRFRADAARDPRDPWPRLGLAMLAERDLDDEGEVDSLLSIVEAAPRHPLAVVAIRRLGELALSSSRVSDKVDAALARALEHGLPGMAAYRARVVRAAAAENRGELDVAARLRAQNGSATEWAVAGPFGAFHALDLDRPFPPEDGAWLLRWERPGRAPLASRVLPAPEGAIALDGETGAGDVWYLAADARIARGGPRWPSSWRARTAPRRKSPGRPPRVPAPPSVPGRCRGRSSPPRTWPSPSSPRRARRWRASWRPATAWTTIGRRRWPCWRRP